MGHLSLRSANPALSSSVFQTTQNAFQISQTAFQTAQNVSQNAFASASVAHRHPLAARPARQRERGAVPEELLQLRPARLREAAEAFLALGFRIPKKAC